jgi:hypothetical protein
MNFLSPPCLLHTPSMSPSYFNRPNNIR